jgi:hypothetical protein
MNVQGPKCNAVHGRRLDDVAMDHCPLSPIPVTHEPHRLSHSRQLCTTDQEIEGHLFGNKCVGGRLGSSSDTVGATGLDCMRIRPRERVCRSKESQHEAHSQWHWKCPLRAPKVLSAVVLRSQQIGCNGPALDNVKILAASSHNGTPDALNKRHRQNGRDKSEHHNSKPNRFIEEGQIFPHHPTQSCYLNS